MDDHQTVIAIGVGCRKKCDAASIVAVVRQAMASSGIGAPCASLFTHHSKAGTAGLNEAATELGMKLLFLSDAALKAASSKVETRSTRVQALFGVPSIAEAAALSGAGPGSCLIVRRLSHGGATCAIAMKNPI